MYGDGGAFGSIAKDSVIAVFIRFFKPFVKALTTDLTTTTFFSGIEQNI